MSLCLKYLVQLSKWRVELGAWERVSHCRGGGGGEGGVLFSHPTIFFENLPIKIDVPHGVPSPN